LTIVQDFPKKKPEAGQAHNIEMVQGKDVNIMDDSVVGEKRTTLTIV
jgi:hypothetical protein